MKFPNQAKVVSNKMYKASLDQLELEMLALNSKSTLFLILAQLTGCPCLVTQTRHLGECQTQIKNLPSSCAFSIRTGIWGI